MKNTFNKLIIVLILCLSLALLSGLAVACSSNGGTPTSEDEPIDNPEEKEPEEEEEAIFVVSYAGGGAEGNLPKSVEGKKGTRIIVSSPSLTKGSQKFLGWSDGNALFQAGDIYVIKGTNSVLTATWESDVFSQGEYTLKGDDTYELTKFTSSEATVEIPSRYQGKYVTSIASNAFRGNDSIVTLTLPGSLQSIGEGALSGMSKLASLTIPFVGGSATDPFGDESKLGYIFGTASYSGSYDAKGFALPKTLTSVSVQGGKLLEGAFSGAYAITAVELPSSVTELPGSLFDGVGLQSFRIGGKVESIGKNALNCTDENGKYTLQNITASIDNKSYTTEKGVLYSKDGTKLVLYPAAKKGALFEVPAEVTSIADNALYGVEAEIDFGNANVKTIQKLALNGYKATSFAIPYSVESIEDGAFIGMENLTSITLNGSEYFDLTDDGILVTADGSRIVCAPKGLAFTSYEVSTSIHSIAGYAFYGMKTLTSIKLNDLVYGIGDYAFAKTAIKTLDVPYGVYSFGNNVIDGGSVSFERTTAPKGFTDGNLTVTYGNGNHTSGDWKYVTRSGSAILTGYTGNAGAVVVPSDLGGKTVTNIGSSLWGVQGITNVILPSSIKFINAFAFADVDSLGAVSIPKSVQTIGEFAFAGKTIKSLTFEATSSVTHIEGGAFQGVSFTEDTSVTLPASLTDMGSGVFAGTNLESVSVNGTALSYISSSAFEGCESLSEILMSESGMVQIMERAFYGCVALTTLDLSPIKTLYIVDASAFENCTGITQIDLPTTLIRIEKRAFAGCSSLTTLNQKTNKSLVGIGDQAFAGDRKLASFTIPETVLYMGEMVFEECWSIVVYCEVGTEPQGEEASWAVDWNADCPVIWNSRENYVARDNSIYFVTDKNLYRLKNSEVTLLRYGGTNISAQIAYGITSYTLTTIGANAYAYTNVKSITFPSTVKYIAEGALRGTSALESLTVCYMGSTSEDTPFGSLFGLEASDGMQGVTQKVTIGNSSVTQTYYYPKVLRTLTINGGTLKNGELSGMTMLNTITIRNNSVVKAGALANLGNVVIRYGTKNVPDGWSALWNSGSYHYISFLDGGANRDEEYYTYRTKSGSVYRTGTGDVNLYSYNVLLGDVVITSDVVSINPKAFIYGERTSYSVEAGNTLFTTENGVLFNADKTVLIAYPGADTAEAYTVPSTVREIGAYAFYGAKNLKHITLSENLESVGDHAFSGSGLLQVILPDDLTYIGSFAFADAASLGIVSLSEASKLQEIGEGAFRNCTALTKIGTLCDSLTTIGRYAFAGLTSLTEIFIPASVVNMGAYAFYDSDNLVITSGASGIDGGTNWDANWNYDALKVEWTIQD